jgi:very-short-patch-repair endonuclease
LAARNKKVLFVAEKRAAIDAVLSRLAKVGLSDIVLDLHSNAVSRRALYQQIADALENHGRIGKQDTEDNERKLEESRRVLAEHKRVMHELHKPWGVSVFDCQSALVGLSRFAPKTRFRSDVIENLGKAERIRIHELLDTFVSLDGLGMESSGRGASPWGNAYRVGDISNIDTAAETLETLQDLRDHLLPDLVKQIRVACEQTGLREPVSISEIDVMLGLWESTQKILSTWEPAVFDLPTATMLGTLQNTSGAARMFSALGNSPYKQAVNALKEACGNRLHQKQLAEELGNVVALQSAWVEVSEGGASPCLPILKKPAELRTQYADACLVLNQVMGRLGFPEWAELSPDELQDLVSALLESSDALYRMPQLTKTKRDLDDVKMGPLIEDMVAQGVSGDDAADFFDYVWYVSIVEYLSLRNPTVASFRGESHQSVVAKFRIADKNHIQSGPARVRRAVAEHAISTLSNYPNQEIIIKKQARLKGRHMPPRLLFEQAGQATRAVKPCWAMSPLVVAQLLPMEQAFDVVIFDEASQVRPAEALGAILRGKQVVVAGDPKQLPPTAFFLSSDSGEVDYDSEETLSAVTDVESILDVMSTLLAPPHGTKMLRWHYRSEDEKLIAFSNAQRSLYNWSLATFPGASSGNSLRHVLVNPPASPTPQSQSVVAEAQEVIKLICEHAATRPQESLGVIAMGTKHAEVINDLLFSEIQRNNALAEWIEGGPPAHRGEKLFVKNLERVQGDERDCIILTVGYGKSPDGRMMYRFGPLNMEGGERRLNVAITRARKHMTVVSSFSSREMDPAKLKAEGAQMLQRYLAYVETQGRDLGPTVLEKPDLNPFERDVQRRLENAGIPLIPQYGASGYWIDFAAQHPTRPGHMVLAIECDGATYHSSPSARDSDRLRQQHLERLGWTFHRIWSTDWFRNPEQETERAVKAWEKAVRLADFENNLQKRPAKSTNRRPPEPQNRPVAGEVAASQRKGPMPIPEERIGKPIDSHSETELIQLIEWISSDGLLRTDEQILDEAVKLLGYKQKGSRIKLRIKEAIRKAK